MHTTCDGYDQIVAFLEQNLQAKRFLHTMGVVQAAVAIADSAGGMDLSKVVTTALLHDCAKALGKDELLQMVHNGQFHLEPEDMDFPAIWHGPAGASIAKERFAVNDPDILDAIANHTLGTSEPSRLLLVLMAADSTEPSRDFDGVDVLRELVRKDLQAGVVAALKMKLEDVKARGRAAHPKLARTIAAMEAASYAA